MTIGDAAIAAFLVAVLSCMMPLLLAAIGETVGEQSGVLNVGLEGVLLVGGCAAFATTLATGSFWLGFLSGAVAGMLLQSLMVLLAVRLGANQIVVGIGMTLAGAGASSMFYDWAFASSRPRLGKPEGLLPSMFPILDAPSAWVPILSLHGMSYATLVLAVLTSLWLHRTAPGLRLRVAGQKPAALDSVGGSVVRTRSFAVLFGGVMAGLGGAYLAVISAGTFTPGMTHGLGFLAIVATMLARGRMALLVAVSLVYGLFVATGTVLQLTSVSIPSDVISMAPFVAVLIALAVFGGRDSPSGRGLPSGRGSPSASGH